MILFILLISLFDSYTLSYKDHSICDHPIGFLHQTVKYLISFLHYRNYSAEYPVRDYSSYLMFPFG